MSCPSWKLEGAWAETGRFEAKRRTLRHDELLDRLRNEGLEQLGGGKCHCPVYFSIS